MEFTHIRRKFCIKCDSKYFETKYGSNPIISIECEKNFRDYLGPSSMLYIGRVLAGGNIELFKGTTYYGHVSGLGEYIHETELGEEVI